MKVHIAILLFFILVGCCWNCRKPEKKDASTQTETKAIYIEPEDISSDDHMVQPHRKRSERKKLARRRLRWWRHSLNKDQQ